MALAMLINTMRDLSLRSRMAVCLVLIIYIAGLFYYVQIINGAGWQYAIPGADMQAHFEGAKALSEGSAWTDLAAYGVRYEGIGINTIGYFVYAQLLSWLIFALPVVNEATAVYLVYVIQIIIMIDALLRFNRCYRNMLDAKGELSVFYILAACVTYAITSYQLLRDALLMWSIAAMFDYALQNNRVLSHRRERRSRKYYVTMTALGIICVALRFYSAMVFLPVVLFYSGYRRQGLISTIAVMLVLTLGLGLINKIKQFTFVYWSFEAVDIGETIRFLMFPNIINQSTYLLDWNAYFGGYNYLSGCNVPGVYYAMAVWNIVIFPLVGISLVSGNTKQRVENLLWLSILVNVAMLYSISYVNIDTRHKLFMSLPMCFLGYRGFKWLNEKSVLFSATYCFGVCACILLAFLIA